MTPVTSVLATVALAGLLGACRQDPPGRAVTPGPEVAHAPAVSPSDAAPPVDASLVRRLALRECAPRPAQAEPGATDRRASHATPVADECVHHADCRRSPDGRCVARAEQRVSHFGQATDIGAHNECVYDECQRDVDCQSRPELQPATEVVCVCNPAEHHACGFANCRADSDCAAPYRCGPFSYCTSAADLCHPSDATTGCGAGFDCVYDWQMRRYQCLGRIAPD